MIGGEPSLINYLDALNAFALVREADEASGLPAAASFKHVSPAGAALAGPIDEVAAETWRVHGVGTDSPISAYVRARDADPKSSFGDVVALSRPVDAETADFLRTVICDAVIAPGFEEGVVETLRAKKSGRFLIFEAGLDWHPPARERREVLGAVIEQDRDAADLAAALPEKSSTARTAGMRSSEWRRRATRSRTRSYSCATAPRSGSGRGSRTASTAYASQATRPACGGCVGIRSSASCRWSTGCGGRTG
ncbi:hypothetical protein GCM10025863_23380 [Microbacterium suwonense]|uniref:Bifunctional purine biosynthesis protein PurH n=1 Tax=Microbacterium suwonense TaxID=683047 RepID=A0ABM8FVN3_9MICO|nr:hypothetical protein [Microbacterium suwonense]BDZ39724.1 hypothetical protein GCM10025863_23380 [Microbacterium suwonense]